MNRDRLEQVRASLGRIGVTPAAQPSSAELPYFGYPGEWSKALAPETFAAAMQVAVCKWCGRLAGIFPGAHAPHHSADPLVVVDCSGRPCVKDAAGYYQVVAS